MFKLMGEKYSKFYAQFFITCILTYGCLSLSSVYLQVGEKLGKYEVEKRQAVENEDYDKAKLKKVQMDEYRLQIYKDLNVQDLLETTGVIILTIFICIKQNEFLGFLTFS